MPNDVTYLVKSKTNKNMSCVQVTCFVQSNVASSLFCLYFPFGVLSRFLYVENHIIVQVLFFGVWVVYEVPTIINKILTLSTKKVALSVVTISILLVRRLSQPSISKVKGKEFVLIAILFSSTTINRIPHNSKKIPGFITSNNQ